MLKATFTASDLWSLVESFLEEKGLARQHIDSFNEFVERSLQEVVDEVGEVPIEVPDRPFKIRFGKVRLGKAEATEADGSELKVYPMEARLRNLTYAAPLQLEMKVVRDGEEELSEAVTIGFIPIMLKSKYCWLAGKTPEELMELGEDPADPGGYFIINGSERVIVALEDLAPNRILVDVDESGARPVYRAKVFSTVAGFRARIELTMKPDGKIYVSIPGVPVPLPFAVLLRALGIERDKEIVDTVSPDKEIQEELEPSLDEATAMPTAEDAILYIGNRVAYGQVKEYRINKAQLILDNTLLPHIGRGPADRKAKAKFLGEMANRVVELKLGRRKPDDKDHYANKRLRFASSLLAELFRTAFRSLCKDIKYQGERMGVRRAGIESVRKLVRAGIITERIQHALATGNWGRGKVGITQLLDRTNFIVSLSHLRRVQSPLSRGQPNFEARELHPTHWGRLCPIETPEGSNCGLVKNIALLATISVSVDPEPVKQVLKEAGVVDASAADAETRMKAVKVFIDGNLFGYTKDPVDLVRTLRELRRRGRINSEVNVAYCVSGEAGEVIVNCDSGRVRRPLIIVDDGIPRLRPEHIQKLKSGEWEWSELIKQGIIEYLDADEEENAFIALSLEELSLEKTHLEIGPYTILGVCASLIPYAEHNQSPRNSYEAAMAKQAIGVSVLNQFNRVDSRLHFLHYPQFPLVTTKPMRYLGYYDRPAGQNCVVAVMSYAGYNMEDALIFNKSSVERGLGWSTFYRVYEAEGQRQYLAGDRDIFEVPEPGIHGYHGEQYYRWLEEDGIIRVGANVEGGDVLIGRTSPPRFLEEYREAEAGSVRRDTSISARPSEAGAVESVLITETLQGNRLIKVKVRDLRIPELGDKFASRHGQKGVIGLLVPQEDLPFTEDGIVPDIIINPHAIPSRMTVGQFLESLAGKIAALKGEKIDGTPFIGQKGLEELLLSLGFQRGGREVLYDGLTGRKYEASIFIGVVYYQKLHHMVVDKMHARARGQVQMLTRQPTEGRTRGGGLRFGEMERDSLIGHGATMLLKDRLLEESDKCVMYLCERCGYLAHYDLKLRKYVCRICEEDAVISPTYISYAFKLLLQELLSLCIRPRLKVKGRI